MNSVCYGCPNRKLGCRTGCDRWQEEQIEKGMRYDARNFHYLSQPEHAHQNAQHAKWQKAAKNGIRAK